MRLKKLEMLITSEQPQAPNGIASVVYTSVIYKPRRNRAEAEALESTMKMQRAVLKKVMNSAVLYWYKSILCAHRV